MSASDTATSAAGQRLSSRLARLSPSATVGLAGKVAQLKAQGIQVISFGQGEPDFATPKALKAAGIAAIEQNVTKYTPVGGPNELKAAIAKELTRDSGLSFTASEVSVTAGAKEGLFLAFLALCDPGDEVIVPAPYWVSYVDQAKLAGAEPVIVETTVEQGFKMSAEQLRGALSPRTKVLVLNSPSNPTGATYSAEELRALADVLRDSQVIVISDEIYDGIVYTGYARWLRVAPELRDRTLIVNGASKRFAMTGWRMGYVAGPSDILEAIKGIQSHSTTHTASITQAAVLPAYDGSADLSGELEEMVTAFRDRRDAIVTLLRAIPGVEVNLPEGAFYVFPNVKGLLNRTFANGRSCADDDELAAYLLEEAHIGVVPGSAFGAPGFIRMSYATGMAQIEEGMRRFAEAVR
jgi:aspartate aminotransferase